MFVGLTGEKSLPGPVVAKIADVNMRQLASSDKWALSFPGTWSSAFITLSQSWLGKLYINLSVQFIMHSGTSVLYWCLLTEIRGNNEG